MNVVIIEDEVANANRLEKLLQSLDSQMKVVARLQTVEESTRWIAANASLPELFFMDIQLTDGLSFEIFKRVPIKQPIIFTTAYDEYALQAFKVNGIDYLLKPIKIEELEKALAKAKLLTPRSQDNSLLDYLKKIDLSRPSYRNRFLVSFRDMLIPVASNEVAYFNSENKTTFLTLHAKERYVVEQTLEEFEHELDPSLFFRATRQFIISQKAISKIHQHFGGKLKLELLPPTKEEVLLSREKSSALKEWLNK
jgi:two-component system, LytTR family, response regulator LytT